MGGHKRLAVLVLTTIGACLCIGGFTGHPAHGKTQEVVAAVAQDFYPEYVLEANGRPAGFAVDMMNEVAKRAGLSVTYRIFETWADLIPALERGDADLVPVLSVTRAREGRILFTRPLVTSPSSLFVRQDADDIRGWTDLAGRRVAVIEGGVSEEILSERYESARLVPYARLTHALFDMLSGEVDALVSFEISVWKVSETARVADRIKVVGDPLAEVQRAIGVRRDLPGLRDRLDAAGAEFLTSSEYRKLYSQWYAAAPSFWNPGRIGWLAGACTALLLLGLLLWQSLSLRAERRQFAASAPAGVPGARVAAALPTPVISRACGLVAVVLGFAVLFGWTFDIAALKTVLPGLFAMQPWAAITIALAGGALLAATTTGRIAAATSIALAGAVLIIGLQTLLQYTTGLDFGTDRWFFPEAVSNQPGHPHPGRVAEVTSIAFALLGTTLLLARVRRVWARGVFSTIGTVGLLLMAAPLLGYLIGAGILKSVAFFTPIALHAALGLVVLFLGVLALRPDTGWMALLSGDRPGATSARMLLPVCVAGPVLLAWLFVSGKDAGLYGPDFQIGLITLATIALLANALLWNAGRLDRVDRARLAGVEALRVSEQRYRNLVEAQPDPICQFLPDTTLTFVNRAYADFYGRQPEDLVGRRWLEFAPKDERPRFLEELTSFTPEKPERHEETRSTRADREVRWYLCHLYGFFDDAGKIVSFQTFGTDITERKRADEALRESERRARAQLDELETIYRTAPVGLALYDRNLNFVRINSALADINGASIEEHLGRCVWDVVPHLRDAVDPQFRKVLETGETVAFEVSGETPKAPGVQRDWVAHYYPLKGPDGSVVAVGAIVQEITDRKRAEEALSESEARLQIALDAARLGTWDIDLTRDTAVRSLRHDQIFGYTELQPEWGRAICERHIVEEDRPVFREAMARGIETGVLSCEFRVRWPDGSIHWISPLGRTSYADTGRPVRMVGVVADITERKRAEEQLNQQLGLLTAITDSAADAIFVSDGEQRVTLMNPAAERIFGWRREELTGRKLHDAIHDRHLDGRPYPASECPLSRAYATGETLVRHEDVFFRKDGSPVPVACSNAPLMIEGRIAGFVLVAHDITERKRAEAALRESETRYRTVGEAIPYGVWICNPEGGVEYVSQSFLGLIGKTLDEVKPRGWLDRLPPEDLRPTLDAWRECVRTGGEWTCEHRVKGKDGIWRTILSLGRPVRDAQGQITSWGGFNLDISERKQAEEALRLHARALRESEIRMRALLDASQDEILLVSVGGEVLAINKAAERRLARRTGGSNPVGAHLDGLLPQDQVEQRMAIVRQVASTATLVHHEVPIRARWFEFWFYPVLQPERPVSEVAVYAREITQQKKSQADLSKLFQAVQQSPMSVVITDRDGNIEYVNPEFTKVTGYALAEAVGRNPRILQSGHTPRKQYAELWNTITGGGVWRGEFRNKKKDGELFWELASIAPVKAGDNIINFVAVKEDITERKEIEEQLRQAQKMEAVGQLTGGIAHDFNNLLAIIIGNLQLLGERVGDDAKTREYLDDALWSARRGGELTHRLLAFARKQPLKPTVIDLNEVVRGMTELLRRTLGASIHIEESLASDLWKAFADRGELERALVNLAVNARDAMRSAGTLTLDTRNAVLDEHYAEQHEEVTPGEYVLLAVTDTGTGMPPEITERVFEPFFTTKEVGQGSGLGLSMVYGFVKQSGGHVSIYSQVGQGTSVKLYLPRSPSLPVRLEEGPPDVPPEGFAEKVVLVVEDEPRLRKVAVRMLGQLGLRSMQAETAKEALELLANTHVDVLFTDIELPGGMNGSELADAARKLDPNIKVLFTTGYAREAILHDKWLQEKVPWLLKPYSHQELARELKALLVPTVY